MSTGGVASGTERNAISTLATVTSSTSLMTFHLMKVRTLCTMANQVRDSRTGSIATKSLMNHAKATASTKSMSYATSLMRSVKTRTGMIVTGMGKLTMIVLLVDMKLATNPVTRLDILTPLLAMTCPPR